MVDVVQTAGFDAVASGGTTLLGSAARYPLIPVDRDAEELVVRSVFAGEVARERAVRLVEVGSHWRPAVIVRDEMDFGSAVAAERLGLPHAAVIVLAAGGLVRPDLVGEPLDALRVEHGLSPDPSFAMLHRHLTIAPFPASFRDPSAALPSTAHYIRPAVLESVAETDHAGSSRTPRHRPRVYVSLGTVFPQESGDLFARVLAGLSRLEVDVIVTVGPELDPAELGPQPPHVQVARFLPLGDVLPRCDAVITHAGSGTVIGALAFGLPMVLLPMGADQPLNADRCVSLGVGIALDAFTATSDAVRAAVDEVLTVPSYRNAARQLQDEIHDLPDATSAAQRLSQLAGVR
jgi:UDP:flavonoid glycosyltransferase YjiC (YdhE family)